MISPLFDSIGCPMVISGQALRLALIGYGNAGRIFHAPLIAGVPGLELACICSSQPSKTLADGCSPAGLLEADRVVTLEAGASECTCLLNAWSYACYNPAW